MSIEGCSTHDTLSLWCACDVVALPGAVVLVPGLLAALGAGVPVPTPPLTPRGAGDIATPDRAEAWRELADPPPGEGVAAMLTDESRTSPLAPRRTISSVDGCVLGSREGDEVAGCVVEGIAVNVVDLMSVGDWPDFSLVDGSVQRHSVLTGVVAGSWDWLVLVSVVCDGLHASTISPTLMSRASR